MKHAHALFISLLMTALTTMGSYAQQGPDRIRINQIGYALQQEKVAAIITTGADSEVFVVLDAFTQKQVWQGKLTPAQASANSSLRVQIADFSQLQQPGRYHLVVEKDTSYPFAIGNGLLNDVAKASIKAFYFQRSAMALEQQYAGSWSRGAGHPDSAVIVHASAADNNRKAGTVIATPGGWYDAGDYNKYVVNSGITMGTMLSAWEDGSAYFKKQILNIPESGDSVPDLLNELVYNLRWMLSMQDAADGGVYHKCTNAGFDGMVMPGVTTLPRYVTQKSTAAALNLAAVAAQAARVLRPFATAFPQLADSCLTAARKAWQWASLHPQAFYIDKAINAAFDPDITTGEYGDRQLTDEWFWASCEMYITTLQRLFLDTAVKYLPDTFILPGWSMVYGLGYYSINRLRKLLPADATTLVTTIQQQLKQQADVYVQAMHRSAFRVVIGQQAHDFVWGSNAIAANQGVLLLNAWYITGNNNYLIAAAANADYLLGRNATGYCFVTGFGCRSPLHPHHRISAADDVEAPVPGLLTGGPNPGMQDGCHYPFTEPETAYTDDTKSFASNEIAINWNAPLVYLLNVLNSITR